MSFWPFAALKNREWILCLDIRLGSDQLKDAAENIGKSGKLWVNSWIYRRSVFLIGREKELKFLLWIKSFKKIVTLAIIQDWDILPWIQSFELKFKE